MSEMMDEVAHAQTALAKALARLLRPLVRIMLRNGLGHRAFSEIARQVFIDVAADDFALPGRRQTVQRISMLTGIPRKEVARRREAPADATEVTSTQHNRAARVIGGWRHDPDFLQETGEPKDLGPEDEFLELVRRYSGDLGPRPVLDELLSTGAAELIDGRLRLRSKAYVPAATVTGQLEILGEHLGDLATTIDHNLGGTAAPYPQRQVVYDNIPNEALAELRELARRRADELTEEFSRAFAAVDRDLHPELDGSGRNRVVVGFYYGDC